MPALVEETPFFFRCQGEDLPGILASPPGPAFTGVLIVVGGPQYRVGSHRQFVHLARHLAGNGVACMRFDYRGMGDGGGAMRAFEQIDADLRAAIDAFAARCPLLTSVVLWGLCDGASAACFYAATDPRVTGLVLVNPWVRTEVGEARVHLRHYYFRRLLTFGFWQKLGRGKMDLRSTATSFLGAIRLAFRSKHAPGRNSAQPADDGDLPLPERMARRLGQFRGRILVLLSGNDYTAKEFCQARSGSVSWARALSGAETVLLKDADHTFSSRAWKVQVAEATAEWVIGPRSGRA